MPARLPPEIRGKVIDLQLRKRTQYQIAEELGISRESVQRILSRYNKRLYERLITEHAAIRGQQVRQLEHMADEAMQAWERSKLDAETLKSTTDEAGRVTRTERTVKSQCGDVSFLSEVRAILAEVRKVLMMDDANDDGRISGTSDRVQEALRRIETFERERPPERSGCLDVECIIPTAVAPIAKRGGSPDGQLST
jgi:hypothetical protein